MPLIGMHIARLSAPIEMTGAVGGDDINPLAARMLAALKILVPGAVASTTREAPITASAIDLAGMLIAVEAPVTRGVAEIADHDCTQLTLSSQRPVNATPSIGRSSSTFFVTRALSCDPSM